MRESKPAHARGHEPGRGQSAGFVPPAAAAPRPTEKLHQAAALIIDDKPTSRSILASHLREMGVGEVVQCSRIADARLRLEARPYDLVLCEYEFADSDFTGQDLLDDLRRCNMLPFSTVFVMITSEASYAKVAEAAESALDVYLLKPHPASVLAERIAGARRRKIALAPIFAAIEGGDLASAARLCLARFSAKGPYGMYAARIGAELLLRLGMHGQARMIYEAVIACQSASWARLGVARAQLDAGDSADAIDTLQALVVSDPGCVDALDVLAQTQFEQGDLDSALETYRRAAELTPGSITRVQKYGTLAFHTGDRAAGVRALERAVTLGLGSKLFDTQSLVLLAQARYLERDARALQRCLADLQRVADRQQGQARLRRQEAVVQTLHLSLARRNGDVAEALRAMAAEIGADDFDFQAASNLVAVIALLDADDLGLDDAGSWIDAIAIRHCVNRATTDLLASCAQPSEPFARRVREAHLKIHAMAEEAVGHTLAGNPRTAVLTLLGHGVKTLNVKLIDLAQAVLDNPRHTVAGAGELRQQVQALRQGWAGRRWQSGGGDDAQRIPGALVIRGASAPRGSAGASAILASNRTS